MKLNPVIRYRTEYLTEIWYDNDVARVAVCYGNNREENAAEIIRRWNNYGGLLATLNQLYDTGVLDRDIDEGPRAAAARERALAVVRELAGSL